MSPESGVVRLWLLRPAPKWQEAPNSYDMRGVDPWQPWYDKCFGYVVRAATEEEARALAHEKAGDENGDVKGVSPWLDPEYSTCVPLGDEGEAGIVMSDFRSA